MSSLVVKPVATRRDQRLFLELPWRLYRDDPNWIPPLRDNQRRLVGFAKHPFYDTADGQAFLAMRDGEPVGRVHAILNHAHNERYDEKRGFFGFFECVNDAEVAAGLFDSVRGWFAEREIRDIRGPVNPSLNYEVGLLVEGFHSPPAFMMTYNPSWYGGLIEGCGFAKTQDLYAFTGHVDMLATLDEKLAFVANEARERFGVHVRPMDRQRFQQEVRLFLELYNASLPGTWGFVPLSDAEVDFLAKDLRFLIVPGLTLIAEVEGKPIGAVFVMLDYNPRIRDIDGRLFPFGFLRLLWKKDRIQNVRILSANVKPEYQGWGVGLVLLEGLVPHILKTGIQNAEFSWVLESNHLSRRSLERGGAIREKTYRIYDSIEQ